MIDTHSHIYSEEFDDDRNEVIARAESAGVEMILLPAIDSKSHDRQEELAMSRPELFRQMMGLHPTSIDESYNDEMAIVFNKLFNNPKKYIAIGEIGLDFYWDTTFRREQIEALKEQLIWATKLSKPVVLHLRSGKDGSAETNAYTAVFEVMKEIGFTNQSLSSIGIMHCFSGCVEDAQKAVAMGFMVGIGGVVTYKKSLLPGIVREIPLQNIVLETDAPFLAPVPYRGRRNESAYVRYVAEKIAEIKGISTEEVDRVTTDNAKRLFGL